MRGGWLTFGLYLLPGLADAQEKKAGQASKAGAEVIVDVPDAGLNPAAGRVFVELVKSAALFSGENTLPRTP